MAKGDSDVKIEHPKGKTYGECIQAENNSIRLVDGIFCATLRIINKPKRMPREDALKYYSDKLREIWGKNDKNSVLLG